MTQLDIKHMNNQDLTFKKSAAFQVIAGMALLLIISIQVSAKDLSDEQYQVRIAQKEFDKANQDYETLSVSIKAFEQRIEQQTLQLTDLKKRLPAKEDRLNKAKTVLEEKQMLLDKAWESNTQ